MVVVNYQAEYGTLETFGPFNTAVEAAKWMNADVKHNIDIAKKDGVELMQEIVNPYKIRIPEYGTWMVTPLTSI